MADTQREGEKTRTVPNGSENISVAQNFFHLLFMND